MVGSDPPKYDPDQEEKIRRALGALQELFDRRVAARSQSNATAVRNIDSQIPSAMCTVGDAYPDQETRRHWYKRAEDYENACPEQKEHIMKPPLEGLGMLIAAPLVLAGGVVVGSAYTAGAILVGAGKLIRGLGSLLTGGNL
ncbi:hypothetical protein NLJ89_g10010 [Agrocybe chaxingu]|uniref:Transmembrane protein n=1 Tax=Agrocybe chaxingu TaxID=84603 RepID=A0A9W8JZI0_9AGAR|nr:hypothetical protein NLJ89_g10010 [Agrocybe chaxingu]